MIITLRRSKTRDNADHVPGKGTLGGHDVGEELGEGDNSHLRLILSREQLLNLAPGNGKISHLLLFRYRSNLPI